MRRTTIIAGIIIIVVLSAGIAALTLWPDPAAESEEQPTTAPPSPAVVLIEESLDDVSSIVFSPIDGSPFTLHRDPSEGGVIELGAEDAIFSGNQSLMRSVFNSASKPTGLTAVTSSADDEQLSMFGFDEPVMIWRVNRADGTSVELAVGALQSAGKGRYVRKQDSREVFLLNERQTLILTHSLEEMYDLSFLPADITPDDEMSLFMIEHILLERQNDVLEFRRVTDEELEAMGIGATSYVMLQPNENKGNDYVIQTVILENAVKIKPESVEAVHPANLTAYGLDTPAKLSMRTEEWSGTLLIGKYDSERGGRYVMLEGHDAVLFDPNGDYSFLDVTPAQLQARLMWLHNIADISSLTFDLDGTVRVLKFEHNSEDDSLSAWLDDKEISETNARRLYIAALNVTQNDETDASIPATKPVYSITMYFLDGGSETLDLYRLNDSQFLIVQEGVNTGFFITRMALQQNFLSRFEILDRGEDIPS